MKNETVILKSVAEKYLDDFNMIIPAGPAKDFNRWMRANGKRYEVKSGVPVKYDYLLESSRPKECFKNALMASMLHDDLKYVEGYMVTDTSGFPLEHGFNINSDGEVVDFTAEAVGIDVVEYYGVEIDRKYFKEFIKSPYNGMASLLTWYFNEVIMKEKS